MRDCLIGLSQNSSLSQLQGRKATVLGLGSGLRQYDHEVSALEDHGSPDQVVQMQACHVAPSTSHSRAIVCAGIFGLRPTLGCYNYSDGLLPATFTRDTVGKAASVPLCQASCSWRWHGKALGDIVNNLLQCFYSCTAHMSYAHMRQGGLIEVGPRVAHELALS